MHRLVRSLLLAVTYDGLEHIFINITNALLVQKTPISRFHRTLSTRRRRRCLFENRAHHLVAQFGCFCESRRKVALNLLESFFVGFEVPE